MLTVSGADRFHHRASIAQLHTISVNQSYIDASILEGFVKLGAPSAAFSKREKPWAPPFGKAGDSTLPLAGDAVAVGWIALGESHFPLTLHRRGLSMQVYNRISGDQKRGGRGGALPGARTTFGFIGSRPSRCNFLRASFRARRMASAFSRTLLSDGFS
jgi:hypothetical protein